MGNAKYCFVTLAAGLSMLTNSVLAQPPTIVVNKELFITDLNVVESSEATSPSGAFHVATLFEAMAPTGKGAKDVMLSVLKSFRSSTLDLPSRKIDEVIINPWKRWPVGATSPLPESDPLPSDEDWEVNWEKAPFRLLAIVNRMDLRHNPTIGNAGEGRFVFGLVDPISGDPLLFTMIFEYLQPASGPSEVTAIANAWHDLGSIPDFNQAYVNELKTVTAKFAGRGAATGRPNGSAINQIRTNEIALNDFSSNDGEGWELREWRIKQDGGLFEVDTVKETPPMQLNDSAFLTFLLDRFGHGLSESLPDQVLGFRSVTGFDTNFSWEAPGLSPNDSRLRRFSVHTCNGCHGGDGQTGDGTPFLHVENRIAGQETRLSRFLTGVSGVTPATEVVDPATGELKASFSDLEIRKLDFQTLVTSDPSYRAFAENFIETMQIRRSRVH